MARGIVNSRRFHVPVEGFSQAIKVPAAGSLVFISGLTARGADGSVVAVGDIQGQTRQVFENLKAVLEAAGGTLDDVVRIVTYLRDIGDEPVVHAVRLEYFGPALPASTSVQIARLYDERQLIEVEATAVIPG